MARLAGRIYGCLTVPRSWLRKLPLCRRLARLCTRTGRDDGRRANGLPGVRRTREINGKKHNVRRHLSVLITVKCRHAALFAGQRDPEVTTEINRPSVRLKANLYGLLREESLEKQRFSGFYFNGIFRFTKKLIK